MSASANVKAVVLFPGVAEISRPFDSLLAAAEEEIRKSMKVGREGRKFLAEYGTKTDRPRLVRAAKRLRKCVALAERFPVLKRDPSLKRKVKAQNDRVVEVPLVFQSKLPMPTVVTLDLDSDRWDAVRVSAQAPTPTQEAARAMKQYKKEFDHLEVWWVPNDILITPIVKPDPVLVGYIEVSKTRGFYFQLHRWIDETVECAWFAKEGY